MAGDRTDSDWRATQRRIVSEVRGYGYVLARSSANDDLDRMRQMLGALALDIERAYTDLDREEAGVAPPWFEDVGPFLHTKSGD